MAQKPIELILMRQLASSLVMPIFLVDMAGTLLFYNEPAEQILGMRFDETGEMPASEWTTRWEPSDADGAPLVPERLPLMVAVQECRPAHRELAGRRRGRPRPRTRRPRAGAKLVHPDRARLEGRRHREPNDTEVLASRANGRRSHRCRDHVGPARARRRPGPSTRRERARDATGCARTRRRRPSNRRVGRSGSRTRGRLSRCRRRPPHRAA